MIGHRSRFGFLALGILIAGTSPASAQEFKLVLDQVSVFSTKADGKAWDVGGGAPDLRVKITNLTTRESWTSSVAFDTYSFTFNRPSVRVQVGDLIEITVDDQDVLADDLIGRGTFRILAADAAGRRLALSAFGRVEYVSFRLD